MRLSFLYAKKKGGGAMKDIAKELASRLSKLLTIKSLVTLIITILFSVLAYKGVIPEEVNTVFLIIIGFYFGTQATKE